MINSSKAKKCSVKDCELVVFTDSSTVKQTMRLFSPSSFCFSSLSRPWKGMELFILQVKASPASSGVSSGRRSACQCLYPDGNEGMVEL